MNTEHIKFFGLFLCSYLAILLYPISYLISPFISVQAHQLILGGITILVAPIYIFSFQKFGGQILQKSVTYTFFRGNIIQRAFASLIIFFLIGLGNAVIIAALTSINAIPLSFWNPVIEGLVLMVCLFALLLQIAIIQNRREEVPSKEEISEAFDRAENALQEMDASDSEESKSN